MVGQMTDAGIRGNQMSREIDEVLRRDMFQFAKMLIDLFPDSTPGNVGALLIHWDEAGDPAEIDPWLARLSEKSDHWLGVWISSKRDGNKWAPILDLLEADVRANPAEYRPAQRLAMAANMVGSSGYDWVGNAFSSPNPSDHISMVQEYHGKMSPAVRLNLILRAGELPFTKTDQEWVVQRRRWMSVERQDIPWEQELRTTLRLSLLDAYTQAGKAQEAQKLMEQLMAENGGEVPISLVYAGQIQGASGARVVEKKVLEAEEKEGDTAGYWDRRADYFEGRQQWKEAERARLRCMELATPEGKFWALLSYLGLLQRTDVSRAYNDFWQRSKGLPPDQVVVLLNSFSNRVESPIRGDDERCWDTLNNSPRWDGYARSVLLHMTERPGKSSRRQILLRGAELAKETDGTRAATLVEVIKITRHIDPNDPLPIVPLLEYAVAKNVADASSSDGSVKRAYENVKRELWEEYIKQNQWRKALALKPTGDASQLAIAAAASGDNDDAMRFWKQATANDRMALKPLYTLRTTGLREALVKYYRQMARELPNNAAPPLALTILAEQ